MTVNPISSSSSYIQSIASNTQQLTGANVRSVFRSLNQALQSGDLQGAQQAFATIQSAWSARTDNNTQIPNGGNNTTQDAFNNLGKALQSGDVQGAQNAFTTLKGALAAHRGGHHHHHASGADPDQGTGSAPSTSTSPSTSIPGVTDTSTLFSSLLQQLASGNSTVPNGVTDVSTLLNALLQQQSPGSNGIPSATGLNTNQSTFSTVG